MKQKLNLEYYMQGLDPAIAGFLTHIYGNIAFEALVSMAVGDIQKRILRLNPAAEDFRDEFTHLQIYLLVLTEIRDHFKVPRSQQPETGE